MTPIGDPPPGDPYWNDPETETFDVPVPRIPLTIDGARALLTYSRESNERLQGIFGQEEEIRQWAEMHDYEIVGNARDVKVHSFSQIDDRPALSAAIEAIQEHKADGLVVHRLDRLARNFPIQDDVMHRVWEAGGRVFSLNSRKSVVDPISAVEWKPDRPGDAQWTSRRGYALRAEEAFLDLLGRLQDGRRRKIARGGYGGGPRIRPRYGVELVEIRGRLEYRPVPAEQEVIRRIVEACPNGRGYEAMAKALNAEGVPTATGAQWQRHTVRALALRGPDTIAVVQADRNVVPLQWADRRATA